MAQGIENYVKENWLKPSKIHEYITNVRNKVISI